MIDLRCRLRTPVRAACFAAAIALLWPVIEQEYSQIMLLQASPFAALSSTLATRSLGLGLGIGWLFLLIAMVKHRWFCRYACPMGFLQEGAARIGWKKTAWWRRFPQAGQYLAILTFIGAAVGYPLLLWLDPLSIFSSALTAVRYDGLLSVMPAGAMLLLLLLLSLTSGQFWCSRLCPLGGTQDLAAKAASLWPRKSGKETAVGPGPYSIMRMVRRGFILGVLGIGTSLWARKAGSARGEDAPLRPPGAVSEDIFTGLCLRCGNCLRACPYGILRPDVGHAGLPGLLAPVLRFDKAYCHEDCKACTQVCPSGAIERLDIARKRAYIIGEALVDGEICVLILGRKECDACERSCPYDAVRIHWDRELYVSYPLVDPQKCNGCGACEIACPTERFKAIRVWRMES
ncbi:MAG TPA: 4Fe-4S dicluster domain-containing protein [Acidobacteriota bacterium]|nr:4Fe-4S dicluster domain-containing protein [Acidobacteriota bacterium]